jgi:hypothetical protein
MPEERRGTEDRDRLLKIRLSDKQTPENLVGNIPSDDGSL